MVVQDWGNVVIVVNLDGGCGWKWPIRGSGTTSVSSSRELGGAQVEVGGGDKVSGFADAKRIFSGGFLQAGEGWRRIWLLCLGRVRAEAVIQQHKSVQRMGEKWGEVSLIGFDILGSLHYLLAFRVSIPGMERSILVCTMIDCILDLG